MVAGLSTVAGAGGRAGARGTGSGRPVAPREALLKNDVGGGTRKKHRDMELAHSRGRDPDVPWGPGVPPGPGPGTSRDPGIPATREYLRDPTIPGPKSTWSGPRYTISAALGPLKLWVSERNIATWSSLEAAGER